MCYPTRLGESRFKPVGRGLDYMNLVLFPRPDSTFFAQVRISEVVEDNISSHKLSVSIIN